MTRTIRYIIVQEARTESLPLVAPAQYIRARRDSVIAAARRRR
jgi:hypothetical protein